jgi:DNA-directed RNA polymerase subunit RPC12/RpoP
MTIFDFLPPPEDDLETLDEEVMVARIAERTGLIFKKQPSDRWLEHPTYEAKYKKATIEVQYSRYDTLDDNNNKRFIGVGYSFAKGGGGSPCDTLTKAVERIKGYQQFIDKATFNEKVYELDIRGIYDDAYCPKCGYGFMDSETDAERCPKCGVKVSWERWHEINDTEEKVITEKCNTCKYKVWLHGEKTRQSCDYNGGHGGCHYEERKCCNNCNR